MFEAGAQARSRREGVPLGWSVYQAVPGRSTSSWTRYPKILVTISRCRKPNRATRHRFRIAQHRVAADSIPPTRRSCWRASRPARGWPESPCSTPPPGNESRRSIWPPAMNCRCGDRGRRKRHAGERRGAHRERFVHRGGGAGERHPAATAVRRRPGVSHFRGQPVRGAMPGCVPRTAPAIFGAHPSDRRPEQRFLRHAVPETESTKSSSTWRWRRAPTAESWTR